MNFIICRYDGEITSSFSSSVHKSKM